MKKFLQDSLRELDHVVWPTRAETKKYFTIVVSMIAICALVLFIFGTAITKTLFAVRAMVTPPRAYEAPGAVDQKTQDILDRLKSLTGSTSTGATSTGSKSTGAGSGAVKINK